MNKYAVMCYTYDHEDMFTEFSHTAFITDSIEVAREYEETQHDKYLGCNNYRVIKIVNVKEK